jgi:ribosomal protein L11 methyltransferase
MLTEHVLKRKKDPFEPIHTKAAGGKEAMADKLSMETTELEIELTPTQRKRISQLSGIEMPKTVSMRLAEWATLAMAAAAAGRRTLAITPSGVKQMLPHERQNLQDAELFSVEVELTVEQREQIEQATGTTFASLLIVPDDLRPAYSETWSEDMFPIRIGHSSFVITNVGATHEVSDSDRIIRLPMDEGGAQTVFGTGRHPATQLSLVLLEEYVKPGDRVLDLGTGSGILAVAAAKLGADEVLALDIDSAAVTVARATIQANELVEVVRVNQGSLEAATPYYDVVAANILPQVIVTLASELAAAVEPGGFLIVGGIVVPRAQEIARAVGLELEKQRALGSWQGMVFRKA